MVNLKQLNQSISFSEPPENTSRAKCNKCGAPWWAADGACPDPKCSHNGLPTISTNYGDTFPQAAPTQLLDERGRRTLTFVRQPCARASELGL